MTMLYNVFGALVSLGAGFLAGSTALIGFGVDSAIEVTASGARRRERTERVTRRLVAWSFLALAAYVTFDGIATLALHDRPERSPVGIAILALSVVVLQLLAQVKRRVARALRNPAMRAESRASALCGYLSGIALIGVALNTLLGWWWADPTAALIMVPIIAAEGLVYLR